MDRRPSGPRERTPSSLERIKGVHGVRDGMLLLAPAAAIPYLDAMSKHLGLSRRIALAQIPPFPSPEAFMAEVRLHHRRLGPLRRIFGLVELPLGPTTRTAEVRALRDLVRHHDLPGNVSLRVLFSRPGFSLWIALHYSFSAPPEDPSLIGNWIERLHSEIPPDSPTVIFSDPVAVPRTLDTAMDRARFLARNRAHHPTDECLPFTEVHELMACLIRLGQRIPEKH
ncbi:MAG: hypothetical protein HQL76_00645 [Magnetococcales bacterium]|nr:hypothetical protein [Magnetococcales bacterium]